VIAFIAAAANVHAPKLVTRNEADFISATLDVVNP
jgi:hypothetical protein